MHYLVYIYILHLSEMRGSREGHAEYPWWEVWVLIVGADCEHRWERLLSSQAPFGSFITPLSSGQFTQFNYATHTENVCRRRIPFKKHSACLLSETFVLQWSLLSVWPFTAGSYLINSGSEQTSPYTLNLLVGQVLNGCTWRPRAVRWKRCVNILCTINNFS